MDNIVFIVGHSTHPVEKFIELLKLHEISAVSDVRSSPYSKVNPQFNREELRKSLKDAGIYYVFLGKELGARSDDPDCYINDKVQYEKLAKTELFKSGIERIKEGVKKYRVTLMCAEKEPLDCHRTILVSRALMSRGLDVKHILANGSLESHNESVARLTTHFNLAEDDMFLSEEDRQNIVYKRQADKIAYVRGTPRTTINSQGRNSDTFEVNQ